MAEKADTETPITRLGHAVRAKGSDDAALLVALDACCGTRPLAPRDPEQSAAVRAAEETLGANPRPIYAFVGLLHPHLGTVGLIISPDWAARCLQGASRCDSGGLAGQIGAFACIKDPQPTLLQLSYIKNDAVRWLAEFRDEVSRSYGSPHHYVSGREPDPAGLKDVRADCIEYGRKNSLLDRRIWTWEIRLAECPKPKEIECIVLSTEMRKRLETFRANGNVVPDSVRILSAELTPEGLHWFDTAAVHSAFVGGSPK